MQPNCSKFLKGQLLYHLGNWTKFVALAFLNLYIFGQNDKILGWHS
jgi:hypothetical protein